MSKLKTTMERILPPIVTAELKRVIRATPYGRGRAVRGPRTNSSEASGILESAWGHLSRAASMPRQVAGIAPSPRWEALFERIRSDISFLSSAREAIHYAQSRIDFDHRQPLWLCQHLFQLHADSLKVSFPQFGHLVDTMGDSEWSRPDTLLRCGGRVVSNVFFFHLYYLLSCLTHVPKTETICEIGGGYGAPARLWLLNPVHPVARYVIIDFPESLFFAEVFLKSNFPATDVRYIVDSAPLNQTDDGSKAVILCPIHLLGALSKIPFDLVVNTGSMQEMTEDWIEFWMSWLDRQDCRWFYSLNYFGQPLSYMAEGGNTWSPRLGPNWAAKVLRFDPAFVRQQTTRNFGEMLVEKKSASRLENADDVRFRFNLLRQRAFDGQALMEAMDIVRTNFDAQIMFELLCRILKEMAFVPKEAYFLADHLSRNASRALSSDQQRVLSEQFAKLKQVRASGQENTYSA